MPNCFTQACSAAALAVAMLLSTHAPADADGVRPAVSAPGVIATTSAYGVDETVTRLKKDIAAKGITLFQEIDHSALAAKSGIALQPSVLLIFGNPPLGTQFITANPQAGLDWPVRMLVYRDGAGAVWVAYTDFGWIAQRHGVTSRECAIPHGIRGRRFDRFERQQALNFVAIVTESRFDAHGPLQAFDEDHAFDAAVEVTGIRVPAASCLPIIALSKTYRKFT